MSDPYIGVLVLEIHMPESSSLKDKRRIVKSLTERLRNKFQVAVSEVGAHDLWQRAIIGIACISAEGSEVSRLLDLVISWVFRQDGFEAAVVSRSVR